MENLNSLIAHYQEKFDEKYPAFEGSGAPSLNELEAGPTVSGWLN